MACNSFSNLSRQSETKRCLTDNECQNNATTLELTSLPCTRNYKLNIKKSLQKKRDACNKPFINIIPKDNGTQTKIECSAGCYELLKREILEISSNPQLYEKFNICLQHIDVSDQAQNKPELIIKAFNRKADGNSGRRQKFTNLYHTQSSLLINGRNAALFQKEIFPDLMLRIQQSPEMSNLDKHTASLIDRCVYESAENPTACTSLIGNQIVISDSPKSKESLNSETLSVCIHCNKEVTTKGIQCDVCSRWYHFACEFIDEYLMIQPYIAVSHADNSPYL